MSYVASTVDHKIAEPINKKPNLSIKQNSEFKLDDFNIQEQVN
jgi:hypothetical protein